MAVSLNMEIVKSKESTIDKESDISTYLGRALSATRKMEDFVLAVRKQISKQEHLSLFSLNEEVKQVIEILSFKATKAGVSFVFHESAAIEMYGDNIKYSQVVLNLLVNAIDSYRNSIENDQVVIVSLSKRERSIIFSVKDSGSGIAPDTMSKIFEPFFSTKASNPDSGMGIGLSLVKKIVEKDFGGTIEVVSMVGEGTEFICRFPYSQK
jgi:signal transduction histidine kinase